MPISRTDLARRIQDLPIIRTLASANFSGRVFLVGGAIRDIALGRRVHDLDFVLEQKRDLRLFEKAVGRKAFLLGKKPLQTHRIVSKNVAIDITEFKGTIRDDLLRRDFTMNAMGYDIKRKILLDPARGIRDIEDKIIRYPLRRSVKDDPLRMLKAIRHFTVLKGFSLEGRLSQAIAADKALMRTVAPERIKYELDLIMLSGNTYRGIRAMAGTGLLFELFPELIPLEEIDREKDLDLEVLGHTIGGFRYMRRAQKLRSFSQAETLHAAWALLFHDLGKPYTFSFDEEKQRVHFFYHERRSRDIAARIMDRLRFSASETKAILALIENHMRIFLISNAEATDRATKRLVYKMGNLTAPLVFLSLLDLYGSSKGKENESTIQVRSRCSEILAEFEEWQKTPLARLVTGNDLLALGYPQGPELGRVLQEIREKQIAGEITEKDEALTYARQGLRRTG